jgi:hypothetical protein
MALYILSEPPEIRHLPWRERGRLLTAARERWGRENKVLSLLVSMSSLSFALTAIVVVLLGFAFSAIPGYQAASSLVFTALISVSLFQKVFFFIYSSRTLPRALQEQMREQGVRPARCFQCRADLTSAGGDECPQCHTPLVTARCPMCGQAAPSSDA